jgi:hypothetical protein
MTLRELSRWFRNYGHDPRHLPRLIADRFIWHKLWTAMDIIDDVDSAVTAYLENDFPSDVGERYLRVYGALQGLFLQQDALLDLIRVILPDKDIHLNDVLKDVREARNASIGHPTQLRRKGALSAHGIVQNSMRKDGFELHSYPEKDGKVFEPVPVRQMIEKQRTESIRILSEVVGVLREREEVHRAQFREIKLLKAFDLVSYSFEKIFEEVRRESTPILRNWSVDHLRKSLNNFEELLKERGLGIDSYATIEYLYGEIEHPLTELTKFLREERSEILSKKSAVVFAKALQACFDELTHIAGEIDEECASAPEPVVQPERPECPVTFTTTLN